MTPGQIKTWSRLNHLRTRRQLTAEERSALNEVARLYARERYQDPVLRAHRKVKEAQYRAARQQDPTWKEKQRVYHAERRRKKKEALLLREPWRALHTPKGSEAYRKRRRERKKARVHADPAFRLACNLRSRVANAIRRKQVRKPRDGSITEGLGCTYRELRTYLETKFAPGMTWGNYGEWHVDHVIPLSRTTLQDTDQFAKAVHYTNLQPLWAKDNIAKSDRLDWAPPVAQDQAD